MSDDAIRAAARALFTRHIECVERDDRAAQFELYAVDVTYEFPFATDRPRTIEGRDEFRRVMDPLWAQARARGARVKCKDVVLTEGADPHVLVAEFTLAITIGDVNADMRIVQVLATRDGKVTSLREYFSAVERAALLR